MSHGKISEKNRKRRRKSSRTPKPMRFIIVVFTVFMTFLFLKGIVSFLTVPPQAKEEAKQIEETLRIQQEEAERLRKQREEEMARAAAEEEKQDSSSTGAWCGGCDRHGCRRSNSVSEDVL